MIEIQRILCPVDFSDRSRIALGHAVAIATCFRSTVTPGTNRTVDTKPAIGKAYREILRIASEHGIELIVLGAHGRTISQLLFGSAAHQVVRQALCPVLTIR